MYFRSLHFTTLLRYILQGHPTEMFHKLCVPQVCISWLEKEVLGSCWEKDFCCAGKLFSIDLLTLLPLLGEIFLF